MSKLSVVVEFQVRPEDMARFYPLLCGHAATSLAEDQGCERFDVMRPMKSDDRVLIYEIWASHAALGVHADSAHTAQYRAASEGMVQNRKLTICALSEGGKA
ncbi:MAG: antibiotic biosynthesis monooxygenase [Candidatus Lambdaproteobacteria bacterium]|nr:antibiotic biosynthesis monooxygenase [Candidatus Lambdaproteobacteria bacterium]